MNRNLIFLILFMLLTTTTVLSFDRKNKSITTANVPKNIFTTISQIFKDKKIKIDDIKILDDTIDVSKKHYVVTADIIDDDPKKWNNPVNIFLFHFFGKRNQCKLLSYKPKRTKNIHAITPLPSVLYKNPAGNIRKDIDVEIQDCSPTATNILCENVKVRTNVLEKPIFEVPDNNYENVRNEWQSNRKLVHNNVEFKYNIPEISSFIQPNFTAHPFSSKIRYDLDHNPNRVPIHEDDKKISGNLDGANSLEYI